MTGVFEKWNRKRDARAWEDLENRIDRSITDVDRLDRLVVIQYFGEPPVQPGEDGYLFIAADALFFAPRKTRTAYEFKLSRVVGFEWSEPYQLLLLTVSTGPGQALVLAYKPHLTPLRLVEEAMQKVVAAKAHHPTPADGQP